MRGNAVKITTQNTSNSIAYDDAITDVRLEVPGTQGLDFHPLYRDEWDSDAQHQKKVDEYVAKIKATLDAFIVQRVRDLEVGNHPEISAMICFRLANRLKANPLP
jgi:formate dehydrogenase maturation protein FdhE